MEVTAILSYIMAVLGFLDTIFSIYGNPSKSAASLLVCLAVFVAVALILLLRVEQNKRNTLQIMSKDNRSLGIRLLLVYQRLLRSKEEQDGAFKASRLIISKAVYSYTVLNGTNPSDPFKDIDCKYTFTVKRTRSEKVHILLVQDQGSQAKEINYQLGNEDTRKATLKAFPTSLSEKGTGFTGLYYAEIILTNKIRKQPSFDLVVTFTLKKAYNPQNKCDAFVICPFLYAKRMHSLEIHADFKDLPESLRPGIVDLRCYPYDGTKCIPTQIANFKTPKDNEVWKEENLPCHTKAVYYLEIRRPTI